MDKKIATVTDVTANKLSNAFLGFVFGLLPATTLPLVAHSGPSPSTIPVHPSAELRKLLKEEDTDRDFKITVEDFRVGKSTRGDRVFSLTAKDGRSLEVRGVYFLSNLLQELKLTQENTGGQAKLAWLDPSRIFEDPVSRISRSIRENYWNALTRRIDREHLPEILSDSKLSPQARSGEPRYLYVSAKDREALAYFRSASEENPGLRLRVLSLPEKITPEFLDGLRGRHGLLALALQKNPEGRVEGVPFVVPGGRFNEMYGWDSYFESLGLLADGRVELARAMVDNFVYQIEHYGKILNANRTYYLTRSQPPFLTSMIEAVYSALPKTVATRQWLARALRAAIAEYQTVWMNPDHLTPTGLSRYFGTGRGIPPEVEPGHFDEILKPFARKRGLPVREFRKRFESGRLREPLLEAFFVHDQAVRESGHDTTYRWLVDGEERCADFVTVDLNALLYKTELDIARFIRDEFEDNFQGEFHGEAQGPNRPAIGSADWFRRAAKRKELMRKYLWDPGRKLFFDYDFVRERRSAYLSATTFYPLWSVREEAPETRILSSEEAEALIQAALSELETPGGVAATSPRSLKAAGKLAGKRQWDWPNGWAPHQILIWRGLRNYGLRSTADRLIYKWLYLITRNAADYNGTIPEKFDVQNRSHAVFAEYGNVGTRFDYITREGFGWMNASYQVGLNSLSPEWRPSLERLIPPEWLSFQAR